MAGLLCRAGLVLSRWPGQPHHGQACQDKPKETHDQPLPMPAADKVDSSQGNAHPHQQAGEEPKCRLLGRNTLASRPVGRRECPCRAARLILLSRRQEQGLVKTGESRMPSCFIHYGTVPDSVGFPTPPDPASLLGRHLLSGKWACSSMSVQQSRRSSPPQLSKNSSKCRSQSARV